ncbi:hypothetical protein, partial [Salmonella sp. SAL4456]|uniref:hypothetical protein n=1 Tax=Salmonella sp. SAL4456 TaxID=3159911 RepID=UPI00397B9ECF
FQGTLRFPFIRTEKLGGSVRSKSARAGLAGSLRWLLVAPADRDLFVPRPKGLRGGCAASSNYQLRLYVV